MKLSDKIIRLRKSNGWSQEDLAEKLSVSRQAISRWEGATAQPDTTNILQLSKLFGVTTDFLLNDEYESDLPKGREAKSDGFHQMMMIMIALEVMILMIQFITTIILQNAVLSILSFIPFVAVIGGFEYAYQQQKSEENAIAQTARKKFHQISAWLGTYFPIRFIVRSLSAFYPRPYNTLVFDCVTLVAYLITATLICLRIEKNGLKGK